MDEEQTVQTKESGPSPVAGDFYGSSGDVRQKDQNKNKDSYSGSGGGKVQEPEPQGEVSEDNGQQLQETDEDSERTLDENDRGEADDKDTMSINGAGIKDEDVQEKEEEKEEKEEEDEDEDDEAEEEEEEEEEEKEEEEMEEDREGEEKKEEKMEEEEDEKEGDDYGDYYHDDSFSSSSASDERDGDLTLSGSLIATGPADPTGDGSAGDTGLTKAVKMSILRRLMKEVKLEQTLDKYRSMPPDSQENSLVSGSGTGKAGKRPVTMTAEKFLWADRQHMAGLEAELERQYQAEMDRREEERADLERQRMRRLMVEGIIGADDLVEDGYAKGLHSRGRRGTIHNNKKVLAPRRAGSAAWRSKSAPEPKTRYQQNPAVKPSRSPHPGHTSAHVTYRSYRQNGTENGESQMSRLEEQENPKQKRCFVHDEVGCTCDEKPVRRQAFLPQYDDPLIRQLGEDDVSVNDLYNIAETILPPDRPKPYMDDNRNGKKKMSAAQERKRREMALAGVVRR